MVKLNLNDFIIEPLVTEKSTMLSENGKFSFRVHPQANKPLVKEALEKMYNVKILSVSIINQKGCARKVRGKNLVRYTSKWKKAIVTLREGAFPFFETAN